MILECGTGLLSMDAGEADIRAAMADDRRRGTYLLLTQADRVYIQATGTGDGPFILDYSAGDARYRYLGLSKVNKARVQETFVSYLLGDGRWQRVVEWRRIRVKPWWKFW